MRRLIPLALMAVLTVASLGAVVVAVQHTPRSERVVSLSMAIHQTVGASSSVERLPNVVIIYDAPDRSEVVLAGGRFAELSIGSSVYFGTPPSSYLGLRSDATWLKIPTSALHGFPNVLGLPGRHPALTYLDALHSFTLHGRSGDRYAGRMTTRTFPIAFESILGATSGSGNSSTASSFTFNYAKAPARDPYVFTVQVRVRNGYVVAESFVVYGQTMTGTGESEFLGGSAGLQ